MEGGVELQGPAVGGESLIPPWARGQAKTEGLPAFPGTQIAMILPEVI